MKLGLLNLYVLQVNEMITITEMGITNAFLNGNRSCKEESEGGRWTELSLLITFKEVLKFQ